MLNGKLDEGLTFDDVLLIPNWSGTHPRDVKTDSQLTRNIRINIPIVSAGMDTVTESGQAIALAQEGGIGFIHRALPIDEQAIQVDKVKKSESGMIMDPVTISPDQYILDAFHLMSRYQISGIPVTQNKKLLGILTNRDLRFQTDRSLKVSQVMTHKNLVTAPIGTTIEEAKEILQKNRIEKLPVVNDNFELYGLITIKDIEKKIQFPNACQDKMGRLRVGAAVGVGAKELERVHALVKSGVDIISVDTAHGHSEAVIDMVKSVKKKYPEVDVIGGNIVTGEAVEALTKAGVDAVKVGIGPGSICTTRIVAGAGMPQITAIAQCAEVANRHGIPVIADGGIKFSGDVTKAIAAGASSVMIGSLFAGTEESPGETVLLQGRSYKVYRGMGSLGSMARGGKDRYFQENESDSKLVPEGIEGRVPFKGHLSGVLFQLVGGLRSGMGYCGCRTIEELRQNGRFIRVTHAGFREGHVHDVIITKEAPNYRMERET